MAKVVRLLYITEGRYIPMPYYFSNGGPGHIRIKGSLDWPSEWDAQVFTTEKYSWYRSGLDHTKTTYEELQVVIIEEEES